MTKPPFIGVETIPVITLPSLASDATDEDARAWIMEAAAATRNLHAAALARRALLPVGGRRPLDRETQLAEMTQLLDEGVRYVTSAAKFVAIRAGNSNPGPAAVRALCRAYRKMERQRKAGQ